MIAAAGLASGSLMAASAASHGGGGSIEQQAVTVKAQDVSAAEAYLSRAIHQHHGAGKSARSATGPVVLPARGATGRNVPTRRSEPAQCPNAPVRNEPGG